MRLTVFFLAFVSMTYCEPVVKEPQDLSVEDRGEHEMEKRHSIYCSAVRGPMIYIRRWLVLEKSIEKCRGVLSY